VQPYIGFLTTKITESAEKKLPSHQGSGVPFVSWCEPLGCGLPAVGRHEKCGARPVGTPDLSHDCAIRVRPVGTVEPRAHGRGMAARSTGASSFNRPYGTRDRGAVAGLKSRRPYGTARAVAAANRSRASCGNPAFPLSYLCAGRTPADENRPAAAIRDDPRRVFRPVSRAASASGLASSTRTTVGGARTPSRSRG